MVRALLLSCAAVSLLAVASCDTRSAVVTPDPSAQRIAPDFDKAAMDALLKSAIADGQTLGISAIVFDEGRQVYSGAFGQRDRERDLPMEIDTVHRIYSMTKPVTSAVIMQLVEEGKLSLTDPASKYVPQLADMKVASLGADGKPVFSDQIRPMTVEDLLLHRAGLGYGIFGDINPVEVAWGRAKLFDPTESIETKMDKLGKLPLIAQPGEAWYYSLSIDILGRIAEVVEGKPLGDIMQAKIFAPLGMTETGFSVPDGLAPRFATNYQTAGDGVFGVQDDAQTSPFLKPAAFQSGGGGLVSTLADYAKFAQAMEQNGELNGNRILKAETVNTMMSNQLTNGEKFLFPWDRGGTIRFGYGGNVVVSDTPETLDATGYSKGQWGWGGAANTLFWIDRPNDSFGILMMQQFQQGDPAVHDDFRALVWKETRDE